MILEVRGMLAPVFAELLRALWSREAPVITPQAFREVVGVVRVRKLRKRCILISLYHLLLHMCVWFDVIWCGVAKWFETCRPGPKSKHLLTNIFFLTYRIPKVVVLLAFGSCVRADFVFGLEHIETFRNLSIRTQSQSL